MAQAASREWDQRHPKTSNGVPTRLYTDENPATTIKGLGYKNRTIAERTIRLTSQPGVRYKQYWTIKAMRERSQHHAHPTEDMKEAMKVFDDWLNAYKPPCEQERKEREKEWHEFRRLCQTASNAHSYGKEPTKEELDRARKDVQCARHLLADGIKEAQRSKPLPIDFPNTSFTGLFGGPGLHGYGSHTIGGQESRVLIDGKEGLEELQLSSSKTNSMGDMQSIEVPCLIVKKLFI